MQPLSGVRVVEFCQVLAGPYCGMLLADLGAEVIKVEPIDGDRTRKLRGFGAGFFGYFNRNKKSLALDADSKEGRAVLVIDAEAEPEASGELVSPTREELMKLKSLHLDDLCEACGITPQDEATKAVMVDLLLAGQEGVDQPLAA